MKIAIVDDEPACLEEIARICRKFGEGNNLRLEISTFSDGESFLKTLDRDCYSVVFMDVYMKGMNGVDTARRLRRHDSSCILIFLTSSGEHMPEAFSCHAFEYITKPFAPERVMDVLKDVLKAVPSPTQSKYIDFRSDRKNVRLFLEELISIVTDAHYLDVEAQGGRTLRCRLTIAQFLDQAENDPRFILINKGIAVNADHIISFENNCCFLDNGTQFPIRVRNRLRIEQAVQNYNIDKIRSRQLYGK